MYEGKANPLQAWSGLRLRMVDVPTIYRHSAQEGGNFISPTRRPALPQGNIPVAHFC